MNYNCERLQKNRSAIAAELEELEQLRERVRKAELRALQSSRPIISIGSNPALLKNQPENLRSVYRT
jgi:hypothetical protein